MTKHNINVLLMKHCVCACVPVCMCDWACARVCIYVHVNECMYVNAMLILLPTRTHTCDAYDKYVVPLT